MMAQFGAGGQPNGTSSVYIRGCSIVCKRDDDLSRLIYLYYHPKQSIIGRQQRMTPMLMALHTRWWPNVVLAASTNGNSSVHIRGCGVAPTQEDGLSRLIYLYYRPIQSIIGRQQRMKPMMMAIHTIWWPNVVLAATQDGTPSVYIRDCSIVCR